MTAGPTMKPCSVLPGSRLRLRSGSRGYGKRSNLRCVHSLPRRRAAPTARRRRPQLQQKCAALHEALRRCYFVAKRKNTMRMSAMAMCATGRQSTSPTVAASQRSGGVTSQTFLALLAAARPARCHCDHRRCHSRRSLYCLLAQDFCRPSVGSQLRPQRHMHAQNIV